MSKINRDLDKYLRKRKTSYERPGSSWWEKIFSSAKEEELKENLDPDEVEKLEDIEHEIEEGEEKLEAAEEYEQELEVEQEKRVGLYHQLVSFFRRKHHVEPDVEEVYDEDIEDDHVRDDFHRLAQIQLKWFERLPLRQKMNFKDSDDYNDYLEILERRGVGKKKD